MTALLDAPVVFDLAAIPFTVRCEQPDLLSNFCKAFANLPRWQGDQVAGFELELVAAPQLPQPGAGATLAFEGQVLLDGYCQMFVDDAGKTLTVFPSGGALQLDPDARQARLTLLTEGDHALLGVLGMAALEAAAYAVDQTLLHTAVLVVPGKDEVILIHAPSGAGKTTTSLALLQGGFGLVSDDAAVLEHRCQWRAWGLPRDLKVHRNTLAMMPCLDPLLQGEWSNEGERRLPLAALRAKTWVVSPTPSPIAAVIWLNRSPEASSIAPMERAAALASLLADNVRNSRVGLLPLQHHRLQMLASLVNAVPVLELRAGPNLDRLPGLIAQGLQL